MSEKEAADILLLAEELVNHLPEEMKDVNDELRELVLRAKEEQDPIAEMEIIDLFSRYKTTRFLMKDPEDAQNKKRVGSLPSGGTGMRLAGDPVFIPPSQRWVCPKNQHDHWVLVIQEGEEAPFCKVDNIKMVRGSKGKR